MQDKPTGHTADEVLAVLREGEVAAIATVAGEKPRIRMMHYAAKDDFSVYLATMKGDPKTLQITNHPSISLLVHLAGADINDAREVEITGQAVMIHDHVEREQALAATAVKSPVVKYLVESGNAHYLDCIKVVPEVVKLRIFREIVQGQAPTVVEFPSAQHPVSDLVRLRMKSNSWSEAVRTISLTASIVPVLLGAAVAAFATGLIDWLILFLTLVAGVAIQAGTNLFNDYFDHRSGADEVNREFVRPFSGGSRVIQLGLLSPLEVLTGALLLCLLSTGIGLYLAWSRGPFVLLLGAVGLLSGVFYTGKPFDWASKGIGEILVALNYGVLMTLGAYFVQTKSVSWLPVVAAIPPALLIMAVLYINEFPDYVADLRSGKKTWVVRLGRQRAALGFLAIMGAVYVALIWAVLAGSLPVATLLALLTLPLAARATVHALRNYAKPLDLAPANAMTAISHLSLGLALTLGFVWEAVAAKELTLIVGLAVVFAGFIAYMYRQIEAQRKAFSELKGAIS